MEKHHTSHSVVLGSIAQRGSRTPADDKAEFEQQEVRRAMTAGESRMYAAHFFIVACMKQEYFSAVDIVGERKSQDFHGYFCHSMECSMLHGPLTASISHLAMRVYARDR